MILQRLLGSATLTKVDAPSHTHHSANLQSAKPPESLAQWLEYLQACHPAEMELGLTRVAAVAERLRLDFSDTRIISFAGTNGKGSCLGLSESALIAAGHSVFSYTSPHFLHYNERLRLNQQCVKDDVLCKVFADIDAARGDTALTYFEFGALAALALASAHRPDFLLLEVGLGGRLDAVNIVDADIAVVSSIALDHQDYLGDDREAIGLEKAGIFRAGAWAICGDPEPPRSLVEYGETVGARLRLRGKDFNLLDVGEFNIPADNIATVAELLRILDLSDFLLPALESLVIPGRFQRFMVDEKEVILDVAHNPAAVSVLTEKLLRLDKPDRVVSLFAIMEDKDYDSVITLAQPAFDAWFLAPLKAQPRALAANELVHILHGHGEHMISLSKNVRQAYRRALSLLNPGDRLVVFGSFFLLAEVMAIMQRDGMVIPGLAIAENSAQ